ncbi:MAG TPA: ABC transporter ATP-binding protein, partial [Chloroflexi bacterium]|nr:ABC transporter ATP-binding protein [Chloroflexota bacterium]
MRRLLKFLKPYTFLIVLATIFLYIQATADLALPDYLSNIVNVGIQQNGVENAVPDAIRQETMDKLLLFMGEDDAQFVLGKYHLAEPGSIEAEDLLKKYPLIEGEEVLFLGDFDQTTTDELNSILGKALIAVSGIQKMVDNPDAAMPFGEGFDFDLSRIPAGMDVFQALGMMPEDMRLEMTDRMEEAFESLGEKMITQMAVGAVKE